MTLKKIISVCPACKEELKITCLSCESCGMELRNSFEISPFDKLDEENYEFLIEFLKTKGNLKTLQENLGLNYPQAKKKLDNLLCSLGLSDNENEAIEREELDMATWFTDKNSTKASEIIKTKLKENGGRVIVNTARGLPCDIAVAADGVSFISNKLPINPPYRFEVFDYIVDLLLKNGGKAKKGNGRNYKLGEAGCTENTVIGYISKHYAGKRPGESVFDPVFVFAAVLEWAGIAWNERGELVLTATYKERIK